MKVRPRFPLLARVLAWLVLHLIILGLAFVAFVRWQLGLGLDSLLSGAAGERLAAFGDEASARIADKPAHDWDDALAELGEERRVDAGMFTPPGDLVFQIPLPTDVLKRARASLPPPRPAPQPRSMHPPARPPPPIRDNPPERSDANPAKSRPAFLMRGGDGAYWAGLLLHLPPRRGMAGQPALLLVRSERLDGSGMFFDFKPWLWGGIAVLVLSVAFWTPFVWSISRYLRRLTKATGEISSGRFQISLPVRGGDELGELGRSIEAMATRLDHLISGQKRCLGDAAHELCAPLARIRTALGILESRLPESQAALISSVEADTAELAGLVDEILAFSRTGNRRPDIQPVRLDPLVRNVVFREAANLETAISIPHALEVAADPRLLDRAVGNLVRNAAIHAGPGAKVRVEAEETEDSVVIRVTDNGPGVPAAEVARIFEPFHRLDPARGRETGGNGLGLAIVRSAVEACGGEVAASLPAAGGLCVAIILPRHRDT